MIIFRLDLYNFIMLCKENICLKLFIGFICLFLKLMVLLVIIIFIWRNMLFIVVIIILVFRNSSVEVSDFIKVWFNCVSV